MVMLLFKLCLIGVESTLKNPAYFDGHKTCYICYKDHNSVMFKFVKAIITGVGRNYGSYSISGRIMEIEKQTYKSLIS